VMAIGRDVLVLCGGVDGGTGVRVPGGVPSVPSALHATVPPSAGVVISDPL